MELDGGEFERKIYVKKDAAALLAQDVSRKYSYTSEKSHGQRPDHIAIGTATDPYQPAEREYGVTRACLEELAKREGLSISIITKSNQIVRDMDVLKKIAARSSLQIDVTVTTLRPRLARLLEPRAPQPRLRLAAVKELREAGLQVGVSASPLLPGITDGEGELEAVAAAAKEAGAQWFFSGVLFLMPSSAKQFLPFVREKFPRLARQYEQWYSKNGYAPEQYQRKASERVARTRQRLDPLIGRGSPVLLVEESAERRPRQQHRRRRALNPASERGTHERAHTSLHSRGDPELLPDQSGWHPCGPPRRHRGGLPAITGGGPPVARGVGHRAGETLVAAGGPRGYPLGITQVSLDAHLRPAGSMSLAQGLNAGRALGAGVARTRARAREDAAQGPAREPEQELSGAGTRRAACQLASRPLLWFG